MTDPEQGRAGFPHESNPFRSQASRDEYLDMRETGLAESCAHFAYEIRGDAAPFPRRIEAHGPEFGPKGLGDPYGFLRLVVEGVDQHRDGASHPVVREHANVRIVSPSPKIVITAERAP